MRAQPWELSALGVSRDFADQSMMLTLASLVQIHFLLLVSRQGKVRLNKWYSIYSQKEKAKIQREVHPADVRERCAHLGDPRRSRIWFSTGHLSCVTLSSGRNKRLSTSGTHLPSSQPSISCSSFAAAFSPSVLPL